VKQQGDGAGEHLKIDKLRVAGQGLGNSRTHTSPVNNKSKQQA
jgi:hypothetical protein